MVRSSCKTVQGMEDVEHWSLETLWYRTKVVRRADQSQDQEGLLGRGRDGPVKASVCSQPCAQIDTTAADPRPPAQTLRPEGRFGTSGLWALSKLPAEVGSKETCWLNISHTKGAARASSAPVLEILASMTVSCLGEMYLPVSAGGWPRWRPCRTCPQRLREKASREGRTSIIQTRVLVLVAHGDEEGRYEYSDASLGGSGSP
jgi:hypothetical protein